MRRSLALLALIAGCSAAPAGQPPAIAWGTVSCDYCHMSVRAGSHPAQLVPTRGAVRVFDEPGCLLRYLAGHPAGDSARVWVRTEGSGQWLEAQAAVYLVPDRMPAGMMYGVLAFGDSASAAAYGDGRLAGFATLLGEFQ